MAHNASNSIHIPSIYHSQLDNGTYSRFERIVAAPSDQEAKIMWSIWLVITTGVSLFVLFVFLAIVTHKKVRKSPFNQYLLFLAVPDFFFSSMCAITCALNLASGHYRSQAMCHFQSFYVIFGIGANAWLNAVIAREMYKMVCFSHQRRRYFPPSSKTVWKQSLTVFCWSAFVAMWPYMRMPHQNGLVAGIACLPVEYSQLSSWFFYCVFLPFFTLIPLVYVLYVAVDIWRKGLIPRTGKTRALAIYFFRLIFVFFGMWLPSLVVIFITGAWASPWIMWAGGAWSHLQGAVSAVVIIRKPDLRKAVREFVSCSAPAEEETHETWRLSNGSSRRLSAVFGFSSKHFQAAAMIGTTSVANTGINTIEEGPCDGESGTENNGNPDSSSCEQFKVSLEESCDTGLDVISAKEPINDEDCSNSQPVGDNEIDHDDSVC